MLVVGETDMSMRLMGSKVSASETSDDGGGVWAVGTESNGYCRYKCYRLIRAEWLNNGGTGA